MIKSDKNDLKLRYINNSQKPRMWEVVMQQRSFQEKKLCILYSYVQEILRFQAYFCNPKKNTDNQILMNDLVGENIGKFIVIAFFLYQETQAIFEIAFLEQMQHWHFARVENTLVWQSIGQP
eukprot:TRINITY_DN1716_c0_g2_i1.p2 TRINITY_DN1716_c0_g2~~TRINITY_DN1716_c0_g2_i1.p2  ORF type:complete len:143 (+),score=4.66 TRINITY_DN1716_c0_g2_i1:64-429(+)